MKKPDSKVRLRNSSTGSVLLDLFVERVTLEMFVILLLLDTLGHGLFITRGEVAGYGFTLFTGFGAL